MKNFLKLCTVVCGCLVASFANKTTAKTAMVKSNPGLYNCNGKTGHCATTPSGLQINGDCSCSNTI